MPRQVLTVLPVRICAYQCESRLYTVDADASNIDRSLIVYNDNVSPIRLAQRTLAANLAAAVLLLGAFAWAGGPVEGKSCLWLRRRTDIQLIAGVVWVLGHPLTAWNELWIGFQSDLPVLRLFY
jgi:hypothetical protein